MIQEIESLIRPGNVEEADCLLLSAPYDRTACGGKGARFGCHEIVECFSYRIEFLDRVTLTEPGHLFRIMHEEIAITNEMPPEEMVETVANAVGRHLGQRLTVLLGGDHSVSIGAFRSLSAHHDPATVTLVQIDAHCDLREDDADSNIDRSCISRFSHASVMRRGHEMGFPIVQVGIRSYSREEHEYFTANGITVFEWGGMGVATIDEVIDAIKTENVYLTLDVDGIDPAYMPATGTPAQGGLEWNYADNLVRTLVRHKTLVGADIVEVAPRADDLLTQMGAARLVYALIGEALMKPHTSKKIIPNIHYSNDAQADRETTLLIAEFNALRAEMLDNFQTARTVATLYLAAVGAIFFATISGSANPNVIILVPGITVIFWWVHLDTRMIVAMLGGYLDILSKRARELGSDRIFTWEQEIRLTDRRNSEIPLGFLPWKIGATLDGVAYWIYLPPGIVSLWVTFGKVGGFTIYEGSSQQLKPFFTFPELTWTISVSALFIVFIRAIITDQAWWKAPDSFGKSENRTNNHGQ